MGDIHKFDARVLPEMGLVVLDGEFQDIWMHIYPLNGVTHQIHYHCGNQSIFQRFLSDGERN